MTVTLKKQQVGVCRKKGKLSADNKELAHSLSVGYQALLQRLVLNECISHQMICSSAVLSVMHTC